MAERLTRRKVESLSDPEVLADVDFLLSLGRPNHEIARRCRVGLAALEKRYGKRLTADDRRLVG